MSNRSDQKRVLVIGVLYVAAKIGEAQWLHSFAYSNATSPFYGAVISAWFLAGIPVVGVTALVVTWWGSRRGSGELAVALSMVSKRRFATVLVLSFVIHLELGNFSIWPWYWLEPTGATVSSYLAVARSPYWLHSFLVVISGGLLIPVVEEVVFRFGLLRMIKEKTSSASLAVVGSALIFGLLHARNVFTYSTFDLHNMAFVFFMAVVNGWLVLRYRDGLLLAIVVHCCRNSLEVGFAMSSAHRALYGVVTGGG